MQNPNNYGMGSLSSFSKKNGFKPKKVRMPMDFTNMPLEERFVPRGKMRREKERQREYERKQKKQLKLKQRAEQRNGNAKKNSFKMESYCYRFQPHRIAA